MRCGAVEANSREKQPDQRVVRIKPTASHFISPLTCHTPPPLQWRAALSFVFTALTEPCADSSQFMFINHV